MRRTSPELEAEVVALYRGDISISQRKVAEAVGLSLSVVEKIIARNGGISPEERSLRFSAHRRAYHAALSEELKEARSKAISGTHRASIIQKVESWRQKIWEARYRKFPDRLPRKMHLTRLYEEVHGRGCAICGFDEVVHLHHITTTTVTQLCPNHHHMHHHGKLELPADIKLVDAFRIPSCCKNCGAEFEAPYMERSTYCPNCANDIKHQSRRNKNLE